MTKSDEEKNAQEEAEAATAGTSAGDALRTLAVGKGMDVAREFLAAVVKAHSTDPFLKRTQIREEMTVKEVGDEISITFESMINTFIISLLRTVQKSEQLIAATGLLTCEGIPWDSENFEPEEIFAEADRLVREAAAKAQDKGSN